MLAIPPCGASSNIALWRAKIKPPVELVVGDLAIYKQGTARIEKVYFLMWLCFVPLQNRGGGKDVKMR